MTGQLSPEERQRLEELFERIADLSPPEQAEVLDRECGASGRLREELLRLLEGDAAFDTLRRLQPTVPMQPGTLIGAYKLLERIGEGGMGEIYAAVQLPPGERRVALKVIKRGMDSAQVVARFEAERQALARMEHAHIAHVYDGGSMPDGRPFFVMEFVAGVPITDYCDRHQLTTRQRLELFVGVCAGVQHAHLKGIIHRDLKPSNLLVTEQDGRPLAKVIDFGVARATTGRLAERTLHTMLGQIVGTLDYMSPEQADPTGLDIDTRSDVYSLGVVLYELLSGLLPLDHSSAGDVSLLTIQRSIVEQEPPKPSTRLRRLTDMANMLAPRHGTDRRALLRQLKGDLDWICLKALEKSPARRYQSVAELAEDVQRHLAHLPVRAGRPGAIYRARKLVRRNRAAVAAGVLMLGLAVASVFGFIASQTTQANRPFVDSSRLADLLKQADKLWPPYEDRDHPHMIHDLETWRDQARELADTLDARRADLSAMDASPVENYAYKARRRALEALTQGLSELVDPATGLLGGEDAVSREHGWSVPHRLAFAERMKAGFAKDGEFERQWAQWARDSGFKLEPQIGLVPIGKDPDSERWEFAHLMTGTPAQRDGEGHIVRTGAMGIVFVWMPEDTFWMGADSRPSGGHNLEDHPPRGASPAHQVTLSAHFLSKYEMTQEQWQRLTGNNPSRFRRDEKWDQQSQRGWDPQWLDAKRFAVLGQDLPPHPVEQVSWENCMTWLPRAGLCLPSEAQWEHGARAGTDGPFSLPTRPDFANVNDDYARLHGGREHDEEHGGRPEDGTPKEMDDGSTMHAPVGSYPANGFGLHDVHGNVYEWCLDGFDYDYYQHSRLRDPIAPSVGEEPRIYRGGSYRVPAVFARSSVRNYYPPAMAGQALGVRPCLVIGVPQVFAITPPAVGPVPRPVLLAIHRGEQVLARHLVTLQSDQPTNTALSLPPGDYRALVTLEGRELASVLFTVGATEGPPLRIVLQ
jgi:serine/threonine protein kinase/formylglycine-generating enzyme required for sulfatase activity